MTGEVVAKSGDKLTMELCDKFRIPELLVFQSETEEKSTKILSNLAVSIDPFIAEFDLTGEELGIRERVYFPVLQKLLEENTTKEDIKQAIKENIHELLPKHITLEDILASINYIIHLDYGFGSVDDIDHLGNRRIRSVGELLQNQFRIGLSRMGKSCS